MTTETIGTVCKRFSSGKGIAAQSIHPSGLYPVIGANGLRGYTDTFNFDGRCAVIGRQGAYCGNVRYFEGRAFMTEHAIVAEANENNDSGYLAYKLQEMNLAQYQGQSAQPGLSVNTLSSVHIDMPDLQTQVKVFNTLHKLEDKISNNNAISSQLESLAKTIYDYWFLQFDFPDENGRPYKSSGGKMVWNEELKREIPEGWENGNLYDIANFINGIACQKYPPKESVKTLPVIKINEMHNGFSAASDVVSNDIPTDAIIQNGDILFSWSASLEAMIWNGGTGGLNQHIFHVLPKKYPKHYVFEQLAAYIVNFKIMAEARKTTMGHITTDHLKQSKIVLPPISIANAYEQYVRNIFDKVTILKEENLQFTSLRDFLLPMLMNGQVTFKGDA